MKRIIAAHFGPQAEVRVFGSRADLTKRGGDLDLHVMVPGKTPDSAVEIRAGVLLEINECRKAFPRHYIRLSAYDAAYGRQTTALQFIVQRPPTEPGFRLTREEGADRQIHYTMQAYAVDRPEGERY